MNKIEWYRHKIYKRYCYVSLNDTFYLVNIYGSIISDFGRRYDLEAVDEKELIELKGYKILRQHILKLQSILYQELLK